MWILKEDGCDFGESEAKNGVTGCDRTIIESIKIFSIGGHPQSFFFFFPSSRSLGKWSVSFSFLLQTSSANKLINLVLRFFFTAVSPRGFGEGESVTFEYFSKGAKVLL